MRVLKKMIEERRSSPERRKGDFFDRVIDELQKDRSMLMEAIALDLIFVLLFASYETTSLALTMAIKYLSEHPQLLDKLTVCTLCFFVLIVLFLRIHREEKEVFGLSDVSCTRRSKREF